MKVDDFYVNLGFGETPEREDNDGNHTKSISDNILYKAVKKELTDSDGNLDVEKVANLAIDATKLLAKDSSSVTNDVVRDFLCGVAYETVSGSIAKIANGNPVTSALVSKAIEKTDVLEKVLDVINHIV